MADELLCQASDVADVWPRFATLSQSRQTSLVARASQAVHDYCRRWFTEQNVTEVKSGQNTQRLWLKHTPVITVLSVELNGYQLDNTGGDAWTVDNATGQLVRGTGMDDTRFVPWWPAGLDNIVVQYYAGFSAVPDPVIEATCWTVKWMSDQGTISEIYKSETLGDYSYTLNDRRGLGTLPFHIAMLLAPYVKDDAFV